MHITHIQMESTQNHAKRTTNPPSKPSSNISKQLDAQNKHRYRRQSATKQQNRQIHRVKNPPFCSFPNR